METIENIQQRTINLHELPTGKQSFIATIGAIRIEKESDYWGNVIDVPYIYLGGIKILFDKIWVNVEQSGNFVRSKVGKRLQKLELEENDIIAFDAIVERKECEFWDIEGEATLEDTDIYEPVYILPRSYNGDVKVKVYHTEFSKYYGRKWKENFEVVRDRTFFDKEIKEINTTTEATNTQIGYYRHIEGMSYIGRILKNFSNIEKY